MTRRWLERGVFVVAALASIATSPRRWRVDAPALPAMPDPMHATRVIIESSSPPEIAISDGKAHDYVSRIELSPTKHEVLVPAGWHLTDVFVSGRCKLNLFCGGDDCVASHDAFVRVTSTAAVATWHLDATSKPTKTELDPKDPTTIMIVHISSSRPFHTRVDALDPQFAPQVYNGAEDASVIWGQASTKQAVTWTAHATIEGPCPSDAPCEPPAAEHIAITSIERYVPDASR